MRPLPRTWRLLATGAAVTAAAVALSGCDLPGFGAPDPAAEEGESIWHLWQGFFIAALFVGALVWGLLIWVLLRYRRRSDSDDDTVPNQSAYNIPLEIFYTAAPVVVVAVLFGFSVATQERVDRLDDDPDVTVDVVGFQWSWEFRYVDEDLVVTGSEEELPELVLPVDQVVHLRLDADDVAHSFWVPDFLSKRDLIPGFTNEIQVTPTEAGSYRGRCAEYCGLDHWKMLYTVRVVSQEDYEAWLTEAKADADADARTEETESDPDAPDGDEDDRDDVQPGEDVADSDDQDDIGDRDNQTGDTGGGDAVGVGEGVSP